MQDKHGLTVSLAVEDGVSPEREDVRVLLFQSVRELLFNVVKHAGVTAAHVELSRPDPDHVQVVVRDEGVGIGDGQGTGQQSGLLIGGVGLFGIRERFHMLGGSMEIRSAPNLGTCITLTAPSGLPVPAEKEHAAPFGPSPWAGGGADTAAPAEAPKPGRIGILLVDDHVLMRQGLSSLLEAENDLAVIGQASDGQEAIELARRLRPDVILMDASMPVMDGIEATRIIHAEQPDLCIIGLSMFEEDDRACAMIQAGAANYLTKSGRPEVLLSAIRRHKEQRG
jgi:CheY-like chemotaxis protein